MVIESGKLKIDNVPCEYSWIFFPNEWDGLIGHDEYDFLEWSEFTARILIIIPGSLLFFIVQAEPHALINPAATNTFKRLFMYT